MKGAGVGFGRVTAQPNNFNKNKNIQILLF